MESYFQVTYLFLHKQTDIRKGFAAVLKFKKKETQGIIPLFCPFRSEAKPNIPVTSNCITLPTSIA